MQRSLKITWLGHACFKIERDNYSIIFDPYEDGSVPGLSNIREHANSVLCSHEHHDHCFTEGVTIDPVERNPFEITWIDTFHDEVKGNKRGPNRIHILNDGVFKVVHLGDLGCELTKEQEELLKDADAIMIPVGGFYTIDAVQAKELVDRIQPRVTIPMHYRGENYGYDEIGTVAEFTKLCDNVIYYSENSIVITKDTVEQTAILEYQ
ncbi:MAG: MBL fold metallo-hydrolase [bacterium]|nr:MBL fold metallo-hydrolase [bacterium]